MGNEITVIRNYDFVDDMKRRMIEKYSGNREGLHVSDITFCFLQRMLLALHPEKKKLKWRTAKAFERGVQSEASIVSLYPDGVQQKDVKFGKYFEAHPDLIIREGKLIVELKNTDKDKVIEAGSDDYMLYLRQLVYYLVLNEVERGMILVAYASKKIPEVDDIVGHEIILKLNSPLRETLKKNIKRFEFFYEKIVLEGKAEYIKQIPRIAGYPTSWKCMYCDVKEECKASEITPTMEDIRIIRNMDIDEQVNVL